MHSLTKGYFFSFDLSRARSLVATIQKIRNISGGAAIPVACSTNDVLILFCPIEKHVSLPTSNAGLPDN